MKREPRLTKKQRKAIAWATKEAERIRRAAREKVALAKAAGKPRSYSMGQPGSDCFESGVWREGS